MGKKMTVENSTLFQPLLYFCAALHRDITDIRENTQSPRFEKALSLAYYNGIFYWTTGSSVVIEEYNGAQDSYYQNSYTIPKLHQPCSQLMMLHDRLQPMPVPRAPPQKVQVIYGKTRARVCWLSPPRIPGIGMKILATSFLLSSCS